MLTGTLLESVNVGNGWWRMSFATASVIGANTNRLYLMPAFTGSSDGQSTYFWGAMATIETTVQPYQRVVTATDYADVNLPRNLTFDGVDDSLYTAANVDFATVTSDGQARRNLLSNPTQFDASAWTNTEFIVTANAAVAPDGTTTADALVPSTTNTYHRIYSNSMSSGRVMSAFVRANGYNKVALKESGTTGFHASFDLSSVTLLDASVGVAGSIVSVGSGWYRLSAVLPSTVANIGVQINVLAPSYVSGDPNSSFFAGNGTSGVFAWGAQVELGSTATTFQNIGTDKVSVFTGVTKSSDAAAGNVAELSANASSNNGTFWFYAPPNASASIEFRSRGTAMTQATYTDASIAAPVTRIGTALGDIGSRVTLLRLNGVQLASDTGDQGTGNYGAYVLYIGRRNNATLPFNGKLYQLLVRGALTDTATTVQAERWVAARTGVAL